MGSDATTGQVVASAAEVYDQFFVPALFQQWTSPLLEAAGVGPGDRVLDVGCGTGVLTRAAAARVGADGEATGLDRNEGMLTVARRALEPITWHEGVAEKLPFDDASFDRVVSQFVLMFVEDAAAVAGEMARVLAPGGSVAVATWCSVEESPGYAAMVDLLDDIVGEEAADALRGPFSLGAPEAVTALLAPAFPDVTVARHEGEARFESLEAWLYTDIRGWTLADMIDDATYAELVGAATSALGEYVDADGRVRFPAPALIASAATSA